MSSSTPVFDEVTRMTSDVALAELAELRSPGARVVRVAWASLIRDPVTLSALLFLAVVTVCAVAGPQFAPHDPNAQRLRDRFAAPVWQTGDWNHVLGTDNLGRDVL